METTTRTWRLGELEVTARGPKPLLEGDDYDGPTFTFVAKSGADFEALFEVLGGYDALTVAGGDMAVLRTCDPMPLRIYLHAPRPAQQEDALVANLRKRLEARRKAGHE